MCTVLRTNLESNCHRAAAANSTPIGSSEASKLHNGPARCEFRSSQAPAARVLTTLKLHETLSHLTRLGQKPGVQSTLILSRETGAIVRTSGLISNSSSANPNSTLPASTDNAADGYSNGRKESGIHSAEDVARMAWTFVNSAGSMVNELDEEDEVKLLRLRTKKCELVIVPGIEHI